MFHVWSDSREDWEEINWNEKSVELLKEIHQLARKIEEIDNYGKKHAIIALIEELTSEPVIAKDYVIEKVKLLFM